MDFEKLGVLCDAMRVQSKNITVNATLAVNGLTEAKYVNNMLLAMNAIRELDRTKEQIVEEITVSEKEMAETLKEISNDFELLSEELDRDLGNAILCGKNEAPYYIDEVIKTIEKFEGCRRNLETLRERLNFEEEENDNQ